MTQALRFGILGAARIAGALAPAIHAASNAELIGVAARDEARARAFAERERVPQVFASYDALLESDQIDAVYIPLPNDLHAPWAIKALQAGKHVLVEKPSAMTSAQTAQMLSTAKAHNRVVFEGFMYRYHPQFTRALELVQSGAIGELRLVRSSFSFVMPDKEDHRWLRSQGGGGLYDLGCYCVNAALVYFNEIPLEVRGRANFASRRGVPESEFVDVEFLGSLEFAGGKRAVFDCSLKYPLEQKVSLVGTQGKIELEGFVGPRDQPGKLWLNGTAEDIPAADRYQLMVEHFARVIAGTEQPRFDGENQASSALPQMRVLEALMNSAERGGEVQKL